METISTGSLELNNILEGSGIPMGRIVEIYGETSVGKTTLALEVVKNAQKKNLLSFFFDADNSIDYNYLKNIGIKKKNLYISTEIIGENVMDIILKIAKTNSKSIIVLDSVPSLLTKNEKGGLSQLFHSKLPLIADMCSFNKNTLLLINQIRENRNKFGRRERTVGGNSITSIASIRLYMKKSIDKKRNNKIHGNDVIIRTTKNTLGRSPQVARSTIEYGKGIIS